MIPEAKLYQQLLDFEKRLDVNIHKKKFDIQDAVGKPLRTKRTLRIFVSNQAHDQPWQVRAEGPNPTGNAMESTPSWTLRIEGRLMDVGWKACGRLVLTRVLLQPGPYRRTAPTDPKFSHFIKTMIVEIQRDQNLYAESNIVEWRKELMPIKDTDGFEIRRRGDEPVEVRILMALDGQPERYKVSPQLAKLLHITGPETKAGLVNRLWQYIKTQKLLDAEDKRLINMDDDLQQVGRCHRAFVSQY